jgi:SNF2 family DNA or RNA helicase
MVLRVKNLIESRKSYKSGVQQDYKLMKSLENLKAGSNRNWNHTPTKAVRIPEIFATQILEIARSLDSGDKVKSQSLDLESLPLDELLEIEAALSEIIARKREKLCDRTLEQAITFLARRCDGARTEDGVGFNGCDARFGHWLASQIEAGKPLSMAIAHKAYEIICKYSSTQLEPAGIKLPRWEIIEHQYNTSKSAVQQELPEYRLILENSEIALYSPFDRNELSRIKDKEYFETPPKPKYELGSFHSWRYQLSEAERLVERFGEKFWIDPNIEGLLIVQATEKEAERLRKLEKANSVAEELSALIQSAKLNEPLPCGWTLFNHQKKAVEWLLAHRRNSIYRGGILADHMGLGKTLSALVAAKALSRHYNNCPVFVICPSSLRENWSREAALVEVQIETFSWAKLPKPLESQQFIVIADEAHMAQNLKSQRTQKLLSLTESENCLAAWLLTGTPIKNGRPVNLYPLLKAIAHPLSENRWQYEEYYCNAYSRKVGKNTIWDNSGAAHLDELSKKTEDCILRRTKDDCLDLPDKQRIFKPVELEPKQQKAYQQEISELVKSYRDRVKRGEVDPDAEALVTLNILRKVGSSYKVESAIELASELLEQGQQVIVFTEYIESANLLYSRLKEFCNQAEILTGETRTDERQAIVDRFQSGESQIFIGTIKAGGVGLTLTASNNVILVDRPWTPGDAEQAEDRCHRIGQKSSVSAFWIQLGIIDEAIDNLLESKQKRIDLVLKGKRKTLRGIDSPKDLAKQLLEVL